MFMCYTGDLLLRSSCLNCCKLKGRNKGVFSLHHDAGVLFSVCISKEKFLHVQGSSGKKLQITLGMLGHVLSG